MALKKAIRMHDGVTTNYHRILFLSITPNRQNSIAVISYVDERARIDEKNADLEQPYSQSVTYETDYNPTMTIETAYDYLKTLPEYEDAVDI